MDKPEFVNNGQLITDNAYYQWIENVKSRFHSTQTKAAIRVNTEMLRFYWSLGRDLVQMKAESKWGAKVIDQVSLDLRKSFPDIKGFSTTNIKYATRWYLFYNQNNTIGQQVVDQFEMPHEFGRVPWRHHVETFTHNTMLNAKLKNLE